MHGHAIRKWAFHVIPNRTINFPVFRDGMLTASVGYALSAVVVHLGCTPESGHYQALLLDKLSSRFLLADDGQIARPCSDDELTHLR